MSEHVDYISSACLPYQQTPQVKHFLRPFVGLRHPIRRICPALAHVFQPDSMCWIPSDRLVSGFHISGGFGTRLSADSLLFLFTLLLLLPLPTLHSLFVITNVQTEDITTCSFSISNVSCQKSAYSLLLHFWSPKMSHTIFLVFIRKQESTKRYLHKHKHVNISINTGAHAHTQNT